MRFCILAIKESKGTTTIGTGVIDATINGARMKRRVFPDDVGVRRMTSLPAVNATIANGAIG